MTGRLTYLVNFWPFIGCFAVLLSCNPGNTSAGGSSGPAHLLPRIPPGWEQARETLVFSGFGLSDYINGGAEAYFAYGVIELATLDFRSDSNARLTVEIYEMDRSENAYGIFSTDPANAPRNVDRCLTFWL